VLVRHRRAVWLAAALALAHLGFSFLASPACVLPPGGPVGQATCRMLLVGSAMLLLATQILALPRRGRAA
jgi:hypothetical protein